jgi:hypothetical protein
MDGIASFLKPHSPSKPDIAVDYSPDSFLENAQAQFWSMASNETTTYRDLRQNRMESDRLNALRPYIGDNPDYTKMAGFETLTEEDKALVRGEFSLSRVFLGDSKEAALKANQIRNTLLDGVVDGLRAQGQGQDLKTSKEMMSTIVEEAKTYQQEANVKFRGSTNLSAIGGLLAGGAAGSLVDPVNAAATFIGPSAGVKLGKALLQGFALNAGVQAVQQETDEFREWKQQLGAEWGIEERLSNIAFAGFAGSAFEGIARGLKALPSVSMTAAEHLFRNKKASASGGINTQTLADELAIKARQAHIVETAPDNSINGLRNHEAALRDLDNGKLDVPSVDNQRFKDDIINSKNIITDDMPNSYRGLKESIKQNTAVNVTAADNQFDVQKKSAFFPKAREDFNPQQIVNPPPKQLLSPQTEMERAADLKLNAFEGMVERDPEAFVVIDGNATRVADILETVREFDNHVNAFKACGIL